MPSFRFIGRQFEEFLNGVPARDLPAEHFDQLDSDAQQTLLHHVGHAEHPIYAQDDSVKLPEPASEPTPAPEPQPEPAPAPVAA